jgi:type IX secretion system PorP/SprF family membrane protein
MKRKALNRHIKWCCCDNFKIPAYFRKVPTNLNIFKRNLWFYLARMRFLIFLFLLLTSIRGIAQQTPQFSQFMLNRFLYNPAFAGFEDYWDVQSGFRTQWTGINTANRTFYISAHGSLDKTDRTSTGITPYISKTIRRSYTPTYIRKKTRKVDFHQGVGVQLISDQIGPMTSVSLSGSYANHLSLGGERKMSVGGSFGYFQRVLDMTNFSVKDPMDPFIRYSDLTATGLPFGTISGGQVGINMGALYYTRKFYVGFSANQPVLTNFLFSKNSDDNGQARRIAYYDPLIAEAEADMTIDGIQKERIIADLRGKRDGASQWIGFVAPMLFLQTGMDFKSSERWTYSPALLVKYLLKATFVAEVNMRVKYDEQFWVGGSYRHKDAIGIMVGAHLSPSLNFTYVFETNTNGYARQSMGTHEFVLGLKFRNRIFMSNSAF